MYVSAKQGAGDERGGEGIDADVDDELIPSRAQIADRVGDPIASGTTKSAIRSIWRISHSQMAPAQTDINPGALCCRCCDVIVHVA